MVSLIMEEEVANRQDMEVITMIIIKVITSYLVHRRLLLLMKDIMILSVLNSYLQAEGLLLPYQQVIEQIS